MFDQFHILDPRYTNKVQLCIDNDIMKSLLQNAKIHEYAELHSEELSAEWAKFDDGHFRGFNLWQFLILSIFKTAVKNYFKKELETDIQFNISQYSYQFTFYLKDYSDKDLFQLGILFTQALMDINKVNNGKIENQGSNYFAAQ